MSITSERIRRTTHRLAVQERRYCECKAFLAGQSQIRRAEVAAWLLARIAVELDDDPRGEGSEVFTRLAYETLESQKKLLQRTASGPTTGERKPGVVSPDNSGAASGPSPGAVPVTISDTLKRGHQTEGSSDSP